MIRKYIILSILLSSFSAQSDTKCVNNSKRLPLYSQQLSSNSFEASLNLWELSKENLDKRGLSASRSEDIFITFLDAYQQDNLEEKLFYKTKIIHEIKEGVSLSRVIQAEFPCSLDYYLFFVIVSKRKDGIYFLKTIIAPKVKKDKIKEAVKFIEKFSIETINKC